MFDLSEKIVLYHLGGSNIITRVFISEKCRQERPCQRAGERLKQPLLALKMEGGHKPRNMGSL